MRRHKDRPDYGLELVRNPTTPVAVVGGLGLAGVAIAHKGFKDGLARIAERLRTGTSTFIADTKAKVETVKDALPALPTPEGPAPLIEQGVQPEPMMESSSMAPSDPAAAMAWAQALLNRGGSITEPGVDTPFYGMSGGRYPHAVGFPSTVYYMPGDVAGKPSGGISRAEAERLYPASFNLTAPAPPLTPAPAPLLPEVPPPASSSPSSNFDRIVAIMLNFIENSPLRLFRGVPVPTSAAAAIEIGSRTGEFVAEATKYVAQGLLVDVPQGAINIGVGIGTFGVPEGKAGVVASQDVIKQRADYFGRISSALVRFDWKEAQRLKAEAIAKGLWHGELGIG